MNALLTFSRAALLVALGLILLFTGLLSGEDEEVS